MKKLLSSLLFIFVFLATYARATTLTGTLNNPDGSGFNGTLYLSIAQQVGISSLGSCGGPILVVPTNVIAIPVSNGAMVGTWNIYGGDCTLPAGMPYNAVLKDGNGNTMFATQWLITGSTQNVGTVYQGPTPLPPTASLIIPGIGLPGSLACSAQSIYLQTNASGGAYLFPCINGIFEPQAGASSSGTGGNIGASVTGGTANAALYVDGSGNLGQDPTNYSYDSTTHILSVTQPIAASVTGNANTASSLASTPSACTGSNVSYGVAATGNALCKPITFSQLLPSAAYITSVPFTAGIVSGSSTKSFTLNAVPGDAILVYFYFVGSGTISGLSVTDASDTFSSSGLPTAGTQPGYAYLATNVVGGATALTIGYTTTATSSTLVAVAIDLTNLLTSSTVDASAFKSTVTGTGVTDSGNITTGTANDLLLSLVFNAPQVTTVMSSSGYNQNVAYTGIATGTDLRVFSNTSGSAGVYDSTYSLSSTPTNANIALIALKSATTSFPVVSVFGRTGSVGAQSGDYNFSQISGTISSAQLAGSGATTYPGAGVSVSTGSAWGTSYSVSGSGSLAATNSPSFVTPTLGVAVATSINGTTIPSTVTLMTTTTTLLSGQMPTFTGDVTNTALAMTVSGIKGVAFCAGYTPTNGQFVRYTTGGSPNPCYAAATSTSGLTLQTNGVVNGSQTLLNVVGGPGIAATQDGLGNVNLACTTCAAGIPLGITLGIDWPPTTINPMNDEFTTVFNLSNIWNVINQGANVVQDTNSLLSIQCAAHSGDSFVGVYQLIPATPYAVEAKIQLTGVQVSGYYGGLAFRDSGTGKVVSMRVGNGSSLTVDHWASPTSLASSVYTQAVDGQPEYMQVKDDGTNFSFMISKDGVNFLTVYSESRTAYLASPGQIGYMAGSSNATYGMSLGSDWFRRTL